jgi:TnpA family transposase
MNTDAGRRAAARIANATFAARQRAIWGHGTTAVASDSTHFGAFDQNIFTEWHMRYGGRGVLIYWHVEKNSMAVYSQLINCSASEVAAMVEGAIRHGTDMEVEANYTDSHGASEIGFGITGLLGFELLPRLKQINKTKLYRPASGEPEAHPRLTPVLTRPIRWDLIAQQYDQMIKYATAIRVGTASTEAILRRFTRANNTHPPTRPCGGRPGREGRLHRPLPAASRAAAGDQRRAQRHGELEPGQRGDPLRPQR